MLINGSQWDDREGVMLCGRTPLASPSPSPRGPVPSQRPAPSSDGVSISAGTSGLMPYSSLGCCVPVPRAASHTRRTYLLNKPQQYIKQPSDQTRLILILS